MEVKDNLHFAQAVNNDLATIRNVVTRILPSLKEDYAFCVRWKLEDAAVSNMAVYNAYVARLLSFPDWNKTWRILCDDPDVNAELLKMLG